MSRKVGNQIITHILVLIVMTMFITLFGIPTIKAYYGCSPSTTVGISTKPLSFNASISGTSFTANSSQVVTIPVSVTNSSNFNVTYTFTLGNSNLRFSGNVTSYSGSIAANTTSTVNLQVIEVTPNGTDTTSITMKLNTPYSKTINLGSSFNLIFDNTAPTCTWGSGPTIDIGSTGTVVLTCTDSGSGIATTTLAASNFTLSNTNISIASISSSSVTNGRKYTLTLSASTKGSTSITLKSGAVKDNAGNNSNTPAVTVYERQYYTMSFGGNGSTSGSTGSVSCSVTTGSSCNVTLPTNGFTYSGWTFNGWGTSSSSTNGTAAGQSVSISGNTTRYATWKKTLTRTLTYNGNGSTSGSTTSSTCNVDVYNGSSSGSCIVALASNGFTKTGYNFSKWAAGSTSGTQYDVGTSITLSGNATYYAIWTAKPVQVYYHPNGGTIGNSSYTTYSGWMSTNGTSYLTHAINEGESDDIYNYTTFGLTKTGYSVPDGTEWCTNSSGGGNCFDHDVEYSYAAYKAASSEKGTYYELDLWVHWTPNTYKVTLNNQSATSAGTTEVWYQYNTTKTISGVTCYYYTNSSLTTCLTNGYTITNPTKSGYAFGGYYTSTGGSGTQYVTSGGDFTNNIYQTVGDRTLYAKWTAYTLTLKYHVNGGTITTGSDTTRWRANNSFVERSTDSGSTWTAVTAVLNQETTSYDLWNVGTYGATKTGHTISGTTAYNTKADGTGVNINQDNSSSSTTNAVTVARINGGPLTENKTMNIYIKWVPIAYTITLDHQGATSSTYSTICYYYGTATYYADTGCTNQYNSGKILTLPTKTGYIFGGYYTGTNGSGTQYVDANGTFVNNLYQTTGNRALYAKWTAKPIQVYYHPNGGTVGASGYTTYNNWVSQNGTSYFYHTVNSGGSSDPYNYTTFGITRTGYSVPDGTEWCTNNSGGGTCFDHDVTYTYDQYKAAASEKATYYELDLYTHWTINKVYIRYHVNGGSWGGSTNTHLSVSSSYVAYDSNTTTAFATDYGGTINLADWNNGDYINITKSGYIALSGSEWCTGTSGNGTCYNHSTNYTSVGTDGTASTHFCDARTSSCTVTVYVNWTPKPLRVYYHPNGGSVTASGYTTYSNWVSQNGTSYFYHTINSGGSTDPYNYTTFGITRTDYYVPDGTEWCTTTSGGGTCFDHDVSYTYDQYKAAASEKTTYYELDLYTHWSGKSIRLYYHPNGGSVTASGYTTYNNWVSQNGTSYFYSSIGVGSSGDPYNYTTFGITRTGYSVPDGTEWCTNTSGGGTCFDHDVSYTHAQYKAASSDKTTYYELDLYTHWTVNTYKVTLDNQSATSAGTTEVWYQYNTTKTISGVTCYYYSNSSLTTCLTNGYTITKPTKTGYTFGGYYTSTGGSGTQYVDANGNFVNNIYQTATNRTLYAKWTPNTYKVTLDNQSATSAGTTAVWYQYNTTKTISGVTCYYYSNSNLTTCLTNGYTITKPTKDGYKFGGYYTSTGGSGTQYVDANGNFTNNIYQTVGDRTLYAKWTANTWTKNTYNCTRGQYGSTGTSQYVCAPCNSWGQTYADNNNLWAWIQCQELSSTASMCVTCANQGLRCYNKTTHSRYGCSTYSSTANETLTGQTSCTEETTSYHKITCTLE